MSNSARDDVAVLLQAIVQQQTAMLQVQAESVRLQRLLVERLLGARAGDHRLLDAEPVSSALHMNTTVVPPGTAEPRAMTSTTTSDEAVASEIAEMAGPNANEAPPIEGAGDVSTSGPAPEAQSPARGARYYQRPPTPTAKVVKPEELELMRRLQEMRDAGDLILQFGPFKGMTLGQVAMHHPEYIRELVSHAQRPEVRAAAGRLVEALDAADEHKRRTTRATARRGRSTR
jgi:hypothetical protein